MHVVVFALGQVVLVLHRDDVDDAAGALDLFHAHRGHADMADRAPLHVALDRAQALLQRRIGVDTVQVVEVDRLSAERAQALLDLRLERRRTRPAIAALGRDEHVLGDALERLPDRALALAAGVEVGGVDVANARGDRLTHEGHMVGREAVGAEPDARDLEAGERERRHLPQARRPVIRSARERVRSNDAAVATRQQVNDAALRPRWARTARARGSRGGRGRRDTGGTRSPDPHGRVLARMSDLLGDRPDADARVPSVLGSELLA